jgi:hypothetical protein
MVSFVQIAEIFYFGNGTATITIVSTQPRTQGNRNVVLVNWYQSNQHATVGVLSVVDTDGNTYSPIGASIISGSYGVGAWECRSIKGASGSNTITITLDGTTAGNYNGAGCSEYSGANPGAASYGYAFNSGGSGTTSVSLTPATVGDVLVAWFGVTDASTTGNLNTLRGTLQPSPSEPDSLWDEYTSTSLAAHAVGGTATDFSCVVGVLIPQANQTSVIDPVFFGVNF